MKAVRLNVLLKTGLSTITAAHETLETMPEKISDPGEIKIVEDTIQDLKDIYKRIPKEGGRFIRSDITAIIKQLENRIQ